MAGSAVIQNFDFQKPTRCSNPRFGNFSGPKDSSFSMTFSSRGSDAASAFALELCITPVQHDIYCTRRVGGVHMSTEKLNIAFVGKGWDGLTLQPIHRKIANARAGRIEELRSHVETSEMTLHNTPTKGQGKPCPVEEVWPTF
jgi:hypothetical protein